jgi:RNA polymerase sigma-70 factor (sigma-E family)
MRADRERDYVAYVQSRAVSLRRTAYHLCGGWHAAEDLVQEALTRLYLHWDRMSAVGSVDGYTRQILVRVYLEQARRSWFRRMFPTASPPDRAAPPAADPDHRLDLRAALDRLPAGQRTVVVLRFYEGLDVNETARVLKRSPGTVKSQTSAAMARLRDLLPGYLGAARQPASKE